MRSLAFALVLVTCSACVRFAPLPLEPERSAQEFLDRRLDEPRLADFIEANTGSRPASWPPPSWDLDTLMWAAFFHSPRLREARAQWQHARAGIVTAGRRPNPTLSFVPEYSTSAPAGLSPWVLTPQLDLPIETAGKREHRIELAAGLADSARLAVASAAWQLRSELRDALVDGIVTRRRMQALDLQESGQRQIADLLDARVALGAIARIELSQIERDLVRTRVERSRALVEGLDAQGRAAAAIGVPMAELDDLPLALHLGLDEDAEAPTAIDLAVARRQALCRRSDLLGSLAAYEASQAALQLEIAKQYPEIHLGPSYQYDQGDGRWGLGLSIELPVFDRNQGPIAEAEAARKQAAAAFRSLQAEVLAGVDRAVMRVGLMASLVREGDELVAGQSIQLDDARAAFEAGVADGTAVASALVDLDASKLVEVQARADLARALGDLEDVMQTPLDRMIEPDCMQTPHWEVEP